MKRLFALAFAAALLIGCAREKQLTFHVGGTPDELAYWEGVTEQFKEQTGIDVQLLRSTTQTEQRKQSILMALRGRKADPDIMLMDVAWIGQMAASGWLQPLTPYGIEKEPFFDRIVKLADTHNGDLVGVPLYVDGGMLYYRTDLLTKYGYDGPPRTWDELVEMAQTVQEGERAENPDFWGYVWQGAQYEGLVCNLLEVFSSAGGGFFNDKQQPILDTEPNITGLQQMVGFIQDEKISPPNTFTDMKEEEVRQVFQNGDALFERNWPYAWALHKAEGSAVAGSFAIAPLPHFPGHESASTLGGWHVALSAFSDMKEEGAKFIAHITSYDVQKQLAADLGWNPGRTDVYDDEELVAEYPVLPELRKVFEHAIPRPTVPYYSDISLALQRSCNAALAGKMTAKQALDKAQGEVVHIVERYAQ
ncbi:MAG: extracellular solute-binding protein [Chitinivibrionales bacterium]|nr:extracellular solute-binding protein [Chitinivibrionales bacterium]